MLAFLMTLEDEDVRSKLEQLFLLYHKEMLYVAFQILKDIHEAEDVVQSVILKLSTKLDRFEQIDSNKTRAYVIIVVRNMCFQIYNQRKKRSAVPIDLVDETLLMENVQSLDDYIIQIELTKWTAEKLAMISPVYADLLTLRYFYDHSIDEIAELLNITTGNVRVKLHRAKKALADVIGGETYDKANEQ